MLVKARKMYEHECGSERNSIEDGILYHTIPPSQNY